MNDKVKQKVKLRESTKSKIKSTGKINIKCSVKKSEPKPRKFKKKVDKSAMPVTPLTKRYRTEHLHEEIQIPGSHIFP